MSETQPIMSDPMRSALLVEKLLEAINASAGDHHRVDVTLSLVELALEVAGELTSALDPPRVSSS